MASLYESLLELKFEMKNFRTKPGYFENQLKNFDSTLRFDSVKLVGLSFYFIIISVGFELFFCPEWYSGWGVNIST